MSALYGLHRDAVLDDLYRQLRALQERLNEAEAEYNRAEAAWLAAEKDVAEVEKLIDEIECANGRDEWRAEQSAMPIVL